MTLADDIAYVKKYTGTVDSDTTEYYRAIDRVIGAVEKAERAIELVEKLAAVKDNDKSTFVDVPKLIDEYLHPKELISAPKLAAELSDRLMGEYKHMEITEVSTSFTEGVMVIVGHSNIYKPFAARITVSDILENN